MFTISLHLVVLVIVPRLERGAYERDGRGEIAEHELCADAETRAHRAALEASVLSTPVEVSLACPRAREKYCARKVSSFAPASLHSAPLVTKRVTKRVAQRPLRPRARNLGEAGSAELAKRASSGRWGQPRADVGQKLPRVRALWSNAPR